MARRNLWLIHYTASSPDLTHILLADENIHCDEVYTITWRESKYTLIHLPRRIGPTVLSRVMAEIEVKHSIKPSELFGYEPITSDSIPDHPGFKRIVETLNDRPTELRSWIVDGKSDRKCALWRHIRATSPSDMTLQQLTNRIREWTPIVQRVEDLEGEIEFLRAEVAHKQNALDRIQEICDRFLTKRQRV